MEFKNLKIGILMGGLSSERIVSLRSGRAIADGLERCGFRVSRIDLRPKGHRLSPEEKEVLKNQRIRAVTSSNLSEYLKKEKFNCLFLALHGGIGENGAIQGFLEVMGIPYTGSGIKASSLAMDKLTSKRIFMAHGLRVPEFMVIEKRETPNQADIIRRFGLPLVVKPVQEGSSVGVTVVDRPEELPAAIDMAKRYGDCLIEKYIKGKEVHVGILKNRAIGAVEVRPKERFYSYRAKYMQGMTEYIIPPELPGEIYNRALEAGLLAHRALGCRGATRVDLIITDSGEPHVLEVNTIPGMTETSLLPKIALSAGITFEELVREILFDAFQKE